MDSIDISHSAAQKYMKLMRTLSVKHESNNSNRMNHENTLTKTHVDIIQNFECTKLCMPPSRQLVQTQDEDVNSINMSTLINDIVSYLKGNSNFLTWFETDSSPSSPQKSLRHIIQEILILLNFNLKRNSIQLNELDGLLRESELMRHANKDSLDLLKSFHQTAQALSPLTSSKLNGEIKRSKSLKAPRTESSKVIQPSSPTLSDTNLVINRTEKSQLNHKNDHSIAPNEEKLFYVKQTRRDIESKFVKICFCLNKLNSFFTRSQNIQIDQFCEELATSNSFNELDEYLYELNWILSARSSRLHDDFDIPFSSFSLGPNETHENFLKSYYRLINYDYLSFKLFSHQLQLLQHSGLVCQIVKLLLNYCTQNKKESLVFPSDQFKPISWSNSHITLYSTGQSSLKTPTPKVVDQTSRVTTSLHENLLSDLNRLIAESIERLNLQAEIVNSMGYFHIINKSNGYAIEAIEKQHQQESKLKGLKGLRLYLQPKQAKKNEQSWYYYAFNGCIANKQLRSGYCMVMSGLRQNSSVCLWPNVHTTNCKWYFNQQDSTIYNGLNENLVLDFVENVCSIGVCEYAVVVNQKDLSKSSQKWSIEFFC